MEGYDAALYRWEQRYFLKEFVEPVCGINLSPAEEEVPGKRELAELAMRLTVEIGHRSGPPGSASRRM